MKVKINGDLTPQEIVKLVLDKKEKAKMDYVAGITGKASKRDPWMSGRFTSYVWLYLTDIYLWSLKNNASLPQAYRQVADELFEYDYKQKTSWKRALKWIDDHGDPRMNERYNEWYALQDTGKY